MSHFHPEESRYILLHKFFTNVYSYFPVATLKFYAFIVKFTSWPGLGKIIRSLAGIYGKFLKSGKIITLSEAEDLINKSEKCSIGKCRCRANIYKNNQNGKVPENTCIILNYSSYRFSKSKPLDYKSIEKLELIKLIRQFSESYNLFQNMVYCVKPNIYAICNCEKNCMPYKFRFEHGIKEALLPGNFIAKINKNLCGECELCEKYCHFNAISNLEINPEACMGCGLCMLICKNKNQKNAISMVKR